VTIQPNKLWCLPLDVATTPKNGEVIVDSWWVVHPEQGIVLYTHSGTTDDSKGRRPMFCSPQCNQDQRITDHFVETMYPFAEARQIPAVFLRAGDGYYLPKEAVPCKT